MFLCISASLSDEICAHARHWREHRQMTLILIRLTLLTLFLYSGLPSDIEHFLSSGANKVLLKPLDTEAFGKAMKEIRMH